MKTQRQGILRPILRRIGGLLIVAGGAAWTGAAAATADTVRILHSDGDAIQARVDLVQQAKQEINVSYYIVGDDDVPLLFLALLRDAARRGVTVRLLVDGHDGNNQMPRALQAHLQCEGVQIQEYHPPGTPRPYWMTNRMHDKLLIVDGEHLIAGGRNMKSEYYGLDCRNFVDRDVYLRGCTAADARCYFMARWTGCDVGPTDLDGKPIKKRVKELTHPELNCADEASMFLAGQLLDDALRLAGQGHVARLNTGRDWSAEAREVSCIRFLHDSTCGQKTKCPGIADDVLELLAGARCSLVLETPYLVLSKKTKRVLGSLRCQGVRVVILTNSAQTNNHHTAHAAYENDKRWYIRHGIELWELRGCDVHLHAKAAVIDGCIAVIGSYNFDYLSEKRNSEVAVAIYDRATAAELRASIDVHIERANEIGPDLRPAGYSTRYPGIDRKLLKELRRDRLIAPLLKRSL